MAGLPKKYFKMFPGDLARAWKKYKADKRGGSSAPAKKTGKTSRSTTKTGGKMAKAKRSAKATAKKVGRKIRAGLDTRPGKVLTMAGTAAAGGVATSVAVNNLPVVKDMNQAAKSGIQGGLGLAAIMFGRQKWLKGLGAGAVIAAAFGLTKQFLKVNPLAGPAVPAPTLSPSQLRALTNPNGMGIPADIRMNRPADVRMNRPADVRMRANLVPGTGSKGWGESGW